ncbi:hypothetical protein AtEden1_Chr2g0244051 [Arabidopsis thaliana]
MASSRNGTVLFVSLMILLLISTGIQHGYAKEGVKLIVREYEAGQHHMTFVRKKMAMRCAKRSVGQ